MKIQIRNILPVTLIPVMLMATFSAFAALTVIGDLGGESTAPFFDAINAAPAGDPAATALPPPTVSLSISDMLPVSTPEMSPGTVTARPVNLPGMPPVFVLGDDPSSRSWLQHNAAELMRMQATGLIINVQDESGLKSLRQIAPAVEMVPVSGGDLARRLALTHYPALITATGISQ